MMHPEHIFRAYDIRGKYPNELDENFAFEIGKAFGTFNPGKIVVGMDVRLSGPSMKKRLIDGLVSTGCEVIDIGIVTTPMTLFSTWFYNYDGGIMMTASHNPKEFNGFLFNKKGGIPISRTGGMDKIKKIFDSKQYSEGEGTCIEKNVIEDYISHVTKKIKISRPIKVVIDAGNGTAGKIYPKAFRKMGIDVVELFCEPDGNFPNREPDPSKLEGLKHLQKKVVETGAYLGFAYDCDGDRTVVVDENGKTVYVGVIFSIFIKNMLSESPGSKVVYTALDSNAIVDIIKESGGIPVACKVGHTFITEKMLETGAVVAGELSAHYFFKEMKYADDSLFGSLKIIEYLLKSGKKITDYEEEFPRYYSEVSEAMRFPVKESEKFKFVEKLKSEFEAAGHKVDTLEGAKVFFDNGWIMFRAANTEAKIAISYESRNEGEFKRMKQLVDQIIKRIPK
jgi:phosphomannomutase/phosphoglucomutase